MGTMSYVSHLNIFRASVYCHVSKDLRKKLEPTIELGAFVDYTNTPHNYRVYLPSLRMIFVQRNVNFDEEKVMQCSLDRKLQSPTEEELLSSKEETWEVVKQPKIKEKRLETSTQEETSSRGEFRAKWAEGSHAAIPPGQRWGDMK